MPCLSHQVWGSKAIQGVLEMQTRREAQNVKQMFEQDLKIGHIIETQVLQLIHKKYPKAYMQSGYCKEYDIFIPEIQKSVEVKFDQKSKHTSNIVIEIEFGGKPSALSTTKSDFWVIYDGDNFKWFTPKSIHQCIQENNLKFVTFKARGDNQSKKAYLIKKELLYKYAIETK